MSTAGNEPSLGDLWRRLARHATETQLAACAALLPVTIAASATVALTRPQWTLRWWPAIALPLLAASFGIWGIGDRELGEHAGAINARWGWRSVQTLAVAIAVFSASVIVLWLLTHVVGTWIS
jgi:hypothetical protein